MAHFALTLKLDQKDRRLVYQTENSLMFWEDSGELVDLSSLLQRYQKQIWHGVSAISPSEPGVKSRDLEIIKIQLGFACNMACKYCSQNNLRAHTAGKDKNGERVRSFLEKMPQWFSGGKGKDGEGVKVEFWGGESLLYWQEIVVLAEKIRERYPKIQLGVITNGTLIKEEMVDFALKQRLHFVISHDGPGFQEARGRDPLQQPVSRENIRRLFLALNPHGLVSFNATITSRNYSLRKIRAHIAQSLAVPENEVLLTMDLMTPYDQTGMRYVIADGEEGRHLQQEVFHELATLGPQDLHLGQLAKRLRQFFASIAGSQPLSSVGQMCEMDLPSSLAVDLSGNVLTCQNTTALGGHRIGQVDRLEEVRLTSSHHWSRRKECPQCPVVHLCRGSCMFLEGDLWQSACQQHFHWNAILLAVALYHLTGGILTRIEGENIRGKDGVRRIELIQPEPFLQRLQEFQSTLR